VGHVLMWPIEVGRSSTSALVWCQKRHLGCDARDCGRLPLHTGHWSERAQDNISAL
jgi:hypothetical protein